MDKNIKAELWTLRNEVITNLKNIEGLVGKIDSKLEEEDTVSCMSRCPDLAKLLDACHSIELHPDTPAKKVKDFQGLVSRITDQLSIIQVDRYAESMAELISICKKIDGKVGPLASESPMEALWESKFPGVRDKVEEYLEETSFPKKPKPVEIDDKDVKDALDRMNARLAQKDPLYTSSLQPDSDPELAPAWAKDVDSKSSRQIWSEAAEWDDDAHEIFGRLWNQTAERRIQIMDQVLAETIQHVEAYNYYNEQVKIKSKDDLHAPMARYDLLEKAKTEVIAILKDFDPDTIASIIKEKDRSDNWLRWYDWNARLVQALEEIAKQNLQGAQVASSCHSMLGVLSKSKESHVWDPMVIDPATFGLMPMKMPAEKLEAFRRKRQADYMRDLRKAYDWEARQKVLVDADDAVQDPTDDDPVVIDPVTFEARYRSGKPIDSNGLNTAN